MARPNSPPKVTLSVTPSVRVLAYAALGCAAVTLSACGATSNFAPREGYTPPPAREAPRPNFPIAPPGPDLTGVAPPADAQAPQTTATPDGPPPTTAPRGSVSSQALPPMAAPPQEAPPPPPPAPAYTPPPAAAYVTPPPAAAYVPPAPPRVVTTTVTSVAGRVVDVGGKPVSYKVKSGDTLIGIARRLDTTQKQLADDNNLEPPYNLRPGKTLKGPNTRAKAYVVGQGDNLTAIARRFTVTASSLAAANDMKAGGSIRSGQRLELPANYRDTGPVRSTVTTTVPGSGPALAAATPAPSYAPTPSYAPAPSAPPPAQTLATTTTVTSVSGRVVDIGKPSSYRVKKGDTLIAIARKLDTTQEQLVDDNRLKKPYRIQPGQALKGPSTTAKAYVVGPGDNLRAIAQRFSISTASLAAANDMKVGGSIRAGERLELPKGYRDTGPVRTSVATTAPAGATTLATATPPPTYRPPAYAPPATTTTTTTTTAPLRPGTPPVTTTTTTIRPVAPPVTASALPTESTILLSDADIAAAGRGRFAWPVRGSVLSAYGPKGTGQRNDGLDVSAPSGEPVRAAAAGEVVYAGDQVPGFGNLVLVKHDGGWVTAYAHLARSDVRMRQTVAQGQQIGAVGQTGGVDTPQLHFEVRYAPTAKDKARPIDPSLVLPR